MAIQLNNMLRVGKNSRIAFVGAGGKTTAMFQLACQLESPVIVTTSTHLGLSQSALADQHIIVQDQIPASFSSGVTLLTGAGNESRWDGLTPAQLNALHRTATQLQIPLLVEADGSRQLPLKAPAAHEPALPEFIDTLVVVAGLSGIGKSLTKENVHRPELFSQLSGLAVGEVITPAAITQVLKHPKGGLKTPNISKALRKVALLNQVEDALLAAQGGRMARQLLPAYDDVIIASLAQEHIWGAYHPVGGIVLAGGRSSRLGSPKQLLTWRGQPFIRVVVQTALTAGLSPVVVVTGAYADQIVPLIKDLPVIIQHNPDWEAGQSTSVKAGLNALPEHIGGAVFLLTDQPQTPPALIQALIESRITSQAPVVLPLADGHRATPVLFGAETFHNLQSLTGDAGGRALFSQYTLTYVPWSDPVITMDVDTLVDYQRLLNYEDD